MNSTGLILAEKRKSRLSENRSTLILYRPAIRFDYKLLINISEMRSFKKEGRRDPATDRGGGKKENIKPIFS